MRFNLRMRLLPILSLITFAVVIYLSVQVGAQDQNTNTPQDMMKKNSYPVAKKTDQVDDYHGVKVADPYRWLRASRLPATHGSWVEAENKARVCVPGGNPSTSSAIKDRTHKTLELRKVRRAVQGGQPVLLHTQQRFTESKCLYTILSRRCTQRSSRSKYVID